MRRTSGEPPYQAVPKWSGTLMAMLIGYQAACKTVVTFPQVVHGLVNTDL